MYFGLREINRTYKNLFVKNYFIAESCERETMSKTISIYTAAFD